MRSRLTIILTIVVILGLLVILNTVTFVKEQKVNDSELTANRSTYHAGPTGTRAFYDLLSESGHKVIRWRETTQKLTGPEGKKVTTFVVIGRTQLQFTNDEIASLMRWVRDGGQLVIVDRDPEPQLLPKSERWMIVSHELETPAFDLDATDAQLMTAGVTALKPVQPTLLTQNIHSVMPSRFAARIKAVGLQSEPKGKHSADFDEAEVVEVHAQQTSPAPVLHISDREGALLADYLYGQGRITLLGDPYLIANNGISLNDNLQLGINLVTNVEGLIAFDEYHQGRGVTENEFASYFAGTPVLPIAGQIVILILFVILTRAKRFARPLPLPFTDRRSSLEFVASMAELQERSRAFDLAVENIYSRTRRVLSRYAGVDYNSSRSEVAHRVAMRSTIDEQQLETLMRQCEETINGAPTSWRQAIDLVRRLREVEKRLGLRMRSRDVRQAAEKI